MTIYSLDVFLFLFGTMSNSNCCFLTCIQASQETGQVVCYSHLFQNFPQLDNNFSFQFSSVQSLSYVRLFVTPWIAARQASLSITNSRSSPRLKSIESVMPSSHLILCRPLLLLPPIPPSIRVFSNESTLRMRWPKYWTCITNLIMGYLVRYYKSVYR